MSRAKIINYYLEKSREPNFEIDQIRKDLEKNNVDPDEIRIIVRLVDNEIQRKQEAIEQNKLASALVWIGIAILAVGLLVTIGTYSGLINTGNSFILAFGPILSGLSILAFGVARKRK